MISAAGGVAVLTVRELAAGAAAIGATVSVAGEERLLGRAVTDSRAARPGDLFVALRGSTRDGHDFIAEAVARGAAAVLCERLPADLPMGITVLRAADSLRALQDLARWWRRHHAPRVVGVTGSVGKTTTKEMVAAVLAHRAPVLKNDANMNTEVGLPLTLLELTGRHRYAVLEMAMRGAGQIRELARIALPEVGVVTSVGPVHAELLGSIEAVAAAKAELVAELPPEGCAVLNGDDPWVRAMATEAPCRTVLFGLDERCDVRAEAVEGLGLRGVRFELVADGRRVGVESPVPGRHHVPNALAAAAVGLHEGLELEAVAGALAGARVGRLRVTRGVGGCTLLDDTYNASPASVAGALELLAETPGRRIAVLGDMRELGPYEGEAHAEAGRRAAAVVDLLFTVGEGGRLLAEAAREAGAAVRHFEDTEALVAHLKRVLTAGDVVLVKASRALALETVVAALEEPE